MQTLKEVYSEFRTIIWVLWTVAAVRLLLDATSANKEDQMVPAMASVYAGAAMLFLYNGFTGSLDHIGWKKLIIGCLLLAVLCWTVPNVISYTVAQFADWTHGRFYNNPEENALFQKYQNDGLGFFEAQGKVEEELGQWTTRCPPPADTTGGKILTGLLVGGLTTIAGAIWCLLTGILLLGIPKALRRKRA